MTTTTTRVSRQHVRRHGEVPVPWMKLVGAGNDFVLVDAARGRLGRLRREWTALAQWLCDRRIGIGADGLLVLERARGADVRMRIFNPDGSEPSMCGNGIRCAAYVAHRHGHAGIRMRIQTGAGLRHAQILGRHRVRIDMGRPRLVKPFGQIALGHGQAAEAVLIDSGVPHLVCWVEDVAAVDVATIGRRLRHDPRVGEAGANVDFIQWIGSPRRMGTRVPVRLRLRTYERGVEAETRACGTGAVAAAAAACARLLQQPAAAGRRLRMQAVVRAPGGTLRVTLGAQRGRRIRFSPATLEGEARPLAQGTATWNGGHAR